MESEMRHLNESMSGITQQCEEIRGALGPNRDKIRQLLNVHNLLKRLQFIFELPDRLGRCLATGHFTQAVKYHAKATRLLNHYEHLTAFRGIERDCEVIMEKIKGEIYKNMRQSNREIDKLADDMRLLLLLHEDPQSLWKEYISIQMMRLNISSKPSSSIEELTSTYLIPLEHIVAHFEKLFLASSIAEDERSSGYVNKGRNMERPQIIGQIQALNEFVDAVSKHGEVLLRITASDIRMTEMTQKWESELIDRLMSTVSEQLRGFYLRVRKNVQCMWESLLDIICNSAIRRVVSSRLCYDIAEQCIPQVYGNFPKELASDTASQGNKPDAADNLVKLDAGEIAELYTQKGRSLLNEHTMQEGCNLGSLVQRYYLAAGRADKVPSDVSQVWCNVLQRLRYTEQLVETVYPQSPSPDGAADTSDTDFEYRFGSASEGLYVRPLQSSQSVTTASSETPGELTGLGIMPKFGFDMTLNMMNNIDKLFADRVDVYRPVEATPAGVCIGLIRVLLKAFLETVRQMRLKQADYQQLQIDAEYLRLMLWNYTQNDK
ncbi:exocyst complex component Sec5-domain-containing protein [Dichotomocladium elegans]|nr:exocyst complex component Sec5-domain-containing protein [Dichotomocladium elegans]